MARHHGRLQDLKVSQLPLTPATGDSVLRLGRIDTTEAIARVSKLFEGNPTLIQRFMDFVPETHRGLATEEL